MTLPGRVCAKRLRCLKIEIRIRQPLERGRFDAFFTADHLAALNMPLQAVKRSATVTSFDPLTMLPALAVVTEF